MAEEVLGMSMSGLKGTSQVWMFGVALCIGIPVMAAEPAPESESEFMRLDSNRDGVISRQEARSSPQLADNFTGADIDGDGRVTGPEFAAFEVRLQNKPME